MKLNQYAVLVMCLYFLQPFSMALGASLSDVELHGFVSQGYLKSTDNNYLGNSKKGSYEFNEIGINLASEVTDDLNFGIQLFSRDMGDFGNNELNVDWAALDYNYRDWLGFRAGKVKLPFGFYNRKRNADMLRTSIVFPQSVYPEGIREFVVGLYGAALHGTVRIDPLGYLDYELFGGTLNLSASSSYISELIYRYTGSGDSSTWSELQIHHMEGGMLIWNTPLTGLRIGGTTLTGKGELLVDTFSFDFSIDGINTLSLEYDIGSLTFSVESMTMMIDAKKSGFPTFKAKLGGYYGEIAWQALEWMALGASYGEYYPDLRDQDGSALESPDFFGWQKDITLSTKLDISEYWCIKFETHFVDGLGLANLEHNPTDEAEREWMLFAVKTSLNF